MIRAAIIFLVCFAIGALIAIAVRARLHHPYEAPAPAAKPVVPATAPGAPAPAGEHQGHGTSAGGPQHQHDQALPAAAASGDAAGVKAINTTCPSCGMPVDADLAPVVVDGVGIGVGCQPCVAKIGADPQRHLEAARANRKLTR